MKTIRAEARRLLELAADDGELRADLRALAEEILAATEIPRPVVPRAVSSERLASSIRVRPGAFLDEEPACEPRPDALPPRRGPNRYGN